MLNISELSARFGVNAERGGGGEFPRFLKKMEGRRVLVVSDPNTRPLALPLIENLNKVCEKAGEFVFSEREPVADEISVEKVKNAGMGYEYLLAAGSGTLNDVCKYAGFLLGVPNGVYATAPSMDGYTSGVAALIVKGFKITYQAQAASDILIDDDLLSRAPRIMIGAGVGDVLAKDCCLTDWRISAKLFGEEYNAPAAEMMGEALSACKESVPALIKGEEGGTARLMDALLVSGYAMKLAGSSRPASGAEHHMSHFLEMDFLRRGKRIPLHGVKVGLGTAVSCYLYRTLPARPDFKGKETVCREAEKLPAPEEVLSTLGALSCPTRFSELGIPRETVLSMLREAYKIRDRFTILNLYCTFGLMTDDVAEEITTLFW